MIQLIVISENVSGNDYVRSRRSSVINEESMSNVDAEEK